MSNEKIVFTGLFLKFKALHGLTYTLEATQFLIKL